MHVKKRKTKQTSTIEETTDSRPQFNAIKRLMQDGMAGPKKLGSYTSSMRILIVGEGDFSFSLALASVIGGSNLICSSLDKVSQLQVKYGKGINSTLVTLKGFGAEIHHQVDARKLEDFSNIVRAAPFTRIIFTFPDCGQLEGVEQIPAQNSELVAEFLSSASKLLLHNGEVHMVFSRDQCEQMKPETMAFGVLRCCDMTDFRPSEYPGYRPQPTVPTCQSLSMAGATLCTFANSDRAISSRADDAEQDVAASDRPAKSAAKQGKLQHKRRKAEMREEDREWQRPARPARPALAPDPASRARAAAASLFGR